MSGPKTGGSAFPLLPPVDETGRSAVGYPHPEDGMTLRDYFAAHAPQPPQWWIDSYGPGCNDLAHFGRLLADWNWAYADAMLAAREGQA